MKFAVDLPTTGDYADPRVLADLAAEAETAGWDGCFIWDVVFAWNQMDFPVVDPWVSLAAMALQTERMRLGAFMTPIARRRPWQLARQTVALDHLSGGRLTFGAALGYQALDFTPFGEDYDPRRRAEMLDEGLAVLTGLWSGEPVTFPGKHYQLEGVTFWPRPVQSPRIPVWVAAGWPQRKPLRRAAQWDGVYLMTVNQDTNELLTPAEIQQVVAYIKAHRAGDAPFDVALNGLAPADPQAAADLIQPYQAVGATWWVEYDPAGSLDAYRERIRRGPPPIP